MTCFPVKLDIIKQSQINLRYLFCLCTRKKSFEVCCQWDLTWKLPRRFLGDWTCHISMPKGQCRATGSRAVLRSPCRGCRLAFHCL